MCIQACQIASELLADDLEEGPHAMRDFCAQPMLLRRRVGPQECHQFPRIAETRLGEEGGGRRLKESWCGLLKLGESPDHHHNLLRGELLKPRPHQIGDGGKKRGRRVTRFGKGAKQVDKVRRLKACQLAYAGACDAVEERRPLRNP